MKMMVLVSPSAGGKDRILKELVDRKVVQPIISTTSRPMRNGELNGREYNFVDKSKANYMLNNGDFIENRKYTVANSDVWIYGITKDSFDTESDNFYGVILDFQGLKQMEDYLDNLNLKQNLVSIYVDVPLQERLKRSLNREGEMDDMQCLEICRRSIDDNIKVVPAKDYCDYVINNKGDFESTINRILKILK